MAIATLVALVVCALLIVAGMVMMISVAAGLITAGVLGVPLTYAADAILTARQARE